MRRTLLILRILLLGLLVLAASMTCIGLWELRHLPAHLDGVLTRAEGVESKVYASAGNLDTATKAWANAAGEQAASIDGLVRDARGTLNTANAQLEHVAPLLDETRSTIVQVRTTLAGAGDDIHSLAQSGQQVAATTSETIAAVQPVLARVDGEVIEVSPDLNRMIRASAETTEHVSGIATSTDKMAAHLEHDFDAPRPWWKRALPVFTDSAKLAECFTRGNCF